METLERRYAHWQSIMERYEQSGLKQYEFCKINTIDIEKFKYFRSQLATRKKLKEKRHSHSRDPKLIPVVLKNPESLCKLVIKHPAGIECQIHSGISDTVLLKLIRGLMAC